MTKYTKHHEVYYCEEHGCWLTPCCAASVNIGWYDTVNIEEHTDAVGTPPDTE
jgi:hypothetical protein